MSQKDFELIAAILRNMKPEHNKTLIVYWRQLIEKFSNKLQDTYPKFNYHKFVSDCGYEYPKN